MKTLAAAATIVAFSLTSAFASTTHWATDGKCGINDGDPDLDSVIVFLVRDDSIETSNLADVSGWEWGCDLRRIGSTQYDSIVYDASCAAEGETYKTMYEVMIRGDEIFAYESTTLDSAIRTFIRFKACD